MIEAEAPRSPRWLQGLPVAILTVLVLGGLLLRARLLTTLNINWDEFYFLSRVHAHLNGALSDRLLTFHVHLFSWVPSTSASEIEQIFAMRAVMFGCGGVSVAALVWLGRRLLGSVTAGLFAGLACLSFSLVLQFGNSARFDPPIVTAFLVAAALIASERRRLLPVAGVIVAISVLVSIKSVLYVPTLVMLLVARRLSGALWRGVLRDALVFSVVVVVVAGALFAWHVATLAEASADASGGALLAIGSKVTSAPSAFPQKEALLQSLSWDRAFWAWLVIGVVVTVIGARRAGVARAQSVMVLGFAIPLVALSFYRNAFPYFYVSVIPPASLLVGAMLAGAERALGAWMLRTKIWWAGPAAVVVVTVALASPMVVTGWRWFDANQADQVQATQGVTLDGVHQIFPEPVPYIDRCGMVSTFPKVGFFMSTWTVEDYRLRGKPVMADLLAREQPRFVLANLSSLDLSKSKIDPDDSAYALLPEDFAVLRDNFVPHWGPVWVAGKGVTLDDAHRALTTDVLIGGRYRVESTTAVRIDGVTRVNGDVVDLQPGPHTVALDGSVDGGTVLDGGAAVDGGTVVGVATTVVLRTAEARPAPDVIAPKKGLFQSFNYRERPPRATREAREKH